MIMQTLQRVAQKYGMHDEAEFFNEEDAELSGDGPEDEPEE